MAPQLAAWLLAACAVSGTNEEADLVARARRGDPSAFEEIVRRHHARIYTLAYRMLRQREEAEDVTQEAFVKAFESLPSLREAGALRAWLGRIAATLSLSRLRSASHRYEVTGDTPEQRVAGPEAHELERAVREAVGQLAPRYRLAIVSFYIEGRSYEEAARVAGVGVKTLKTRLYRARVQLRALLGDVLEAAR